MLVIVWAAQVNCRFTQRPYPESMPTAIHANVPKLLVRGVEHKFSLQTTPGVECYAGIGYYDMSDKWVTEDLTTIESDEKGVCEWVWVVPENAKNGFGEFRGYIQEKDQSRNIFPATFCIESCP